MKTAFWLHLYTTSIRTLQPHTCPKQVWGVSNSPFQRPPKPRGYAEKSKLSCWELAYCKAQHTTTPTRSHGISKNWVLVYNIITSVIAVRDSPVLKFTPPKKCMSESIWLAYRPTRKSKAQNDIHPTSITIQPLNHYTMHGEGRLMINN